MKKYFPVILLLATFTLSACTANKTIDNNQNKSEENTKTESSKSLKDLLGLGTSQKCSFESKTDDTIVKSEVIMNGKKFKQSSEITNQEGTMKVYAVSDGIYYYSWSDVSKEMGTKIKIEDIEKEDKNIPTIAGEEPIKTEGKQQISMDEKIDYKCVAANLSDSDLLVPTDVKFVDYTEMMKKFQNGNGE